MYYLEDAFHCCLIINFSGKRVDGMYVTPLRYRDIKTTEDKSISLNKYERRDQ